MAAYLDNSATTRVSPYVIERMTQCMAEGFYNPSSVYVPAVDVFRKVRAARERLLRAVHAGAGYKVIYTSGGTEANNLAILGSVGKMRGKQVVAVSAVEHPSVLASFDELAEMGHDVRIIGVDENGKLRMDELAQALDDGASLVSCMHVNNETGAVQDIEAISRLINGRALLHVDGVQGFLRVPFDMHWADMYTLSGHKIHAPKGIGALVVKESIRLKPRQIGGGQEENLRSGTENTPGILGLDAAIEEMLAMGADMQKRLMEKKLAMLSMFKESVPNLLVNGPEPEAAAPHIINISFPDVRGEVMLHALEGNGVLVNTGSACSSKKRKVSGVLLSMGVNAARAEWALRFSISPHTTIEEIEYAAGVLKAQYDLLKLFKRR